VTTDLFSSPKQSDRLRIIPMGGCGEFGMNVTAYLHRNRLFVVDAGLRFADQVKLGTDAVIPDVDPWFAAVGGVHAYVITHGHEDHIGALPYLVERWPAPIYATPWTAALIRNKFTRRGVDPSKHPITVVEAGDKVSDGDVDFEYVHMNHSIPHACALYIRTPAGNVFHTGDFKYDASPVIEPAISVDHLGVIGAEGVDLLLADSTNADKRGQCPGETSVLGPLTKIFAEAPGAVVVTTFSSNLWRLKTIADACLATGRRLFVTGAGVDATLTVAESLEVYKLPDGLRVQENYLDDVPRQQLVVVATGCQGEFRSALARIAYGEHKSFSLHPEDTVVLSSRIIPGNERSILNMLDQIVKRGSKIITARDVPGVHVSGHAYQGDLEVLIRGLKPRCFAPKHGTFTQLKANAMTAERLGVDRLCVIENGDVIEMAAGEVRLAGRLEFGVQYVDSESNVVLTHETLRDRLKIGELGMILVTGTYERGRGWISSPQLDLVGLALPLRIDTAAFMREQTEFVERNTTRLDKQQKLGWDALVEELRITLRRQFQQVLKKKPVVMVKLAAL
jgi:ribonuclease J